MFLVSSEPHPFYSNYGNKDCQTLRNHVLLLRKGNQVVFFFPETDETIKVIIATLKMVGVLMFIIFTVPW